MITDHNQRSKKTKLFEKKTKIKNLEDSHYTILQFFLTKILVKPKLFLGGYLFIGEK